MSITIHVQIIRTTTTRNLDEWLREEKSKTSKGILIIWNTKKKKYNQTVDLGDDERHLSLLSKTSFL
jgi:hypothetical protein